VPFNNYTRVEIVLSAILFLAVIIQDTKERLAEEVTINCQLNNQIISLRKEIQKLEYNLQRVKENYGSISKVRHIILSYKMKLK